MALNYISRLPSDLLDLILSRLPIVDYVRSGAVCRSWRGATAGNPDRLGTKTPWLMLPGTCKVCRRHLYRFFSIPDLTQHKHRFRIPQTRGRIIGSSHGIIMVVCFRETILLDPLTGVEVRMPAHRLPCRLLKLLFSPSKSVAVAMYAERKNYMSFARVGDRSWAVLRTETYAHLHDMIIHKGEFYAVDGTGTILSFDPDPAQGALLTARGYGDPSSFTDLPWNPIRMFLVESLDGDHLLLLRRMLNQEGMTESFKVFTQDKVGRRWVQVGNIGEVAIFVGTNNSTCIFTRGLPGLRGNCIYFTPIWTLTTMEPKRHDFGVFSLEDGSIEQLDSLQPIPLNMWAPFWLTRS